MDEADLRIHLARQTARPVELLDILALQSTNPDGYLDKVLAMRPSAVLFDGLDDRTLHAAGRLMWTRRPLPHSFAAGSSGLIHALVEHWRESEEIPRTYAAAQPEPVDRIVVVSGSCSPVTAGQIRWSLANGYAGIKLDAKKYEEVMLIETALEALSNGQSVVAYTALGAVDPDTEGGDKLGRRLGVLLRDILIRSGVRRAVVAGGDTSSHAVRQLGIESLTFAGVTSPGAPLCRCQGGKLDGLELVLKGGQVGPEDFFEMVRKAKG